MEKNIKLQYGCLALNAIINQKNNTLSIIEIVEKLMLTVPKSKYNNSTSVLIPSNIVLVSMWKKTIQNEPLFQKINIILKDPDEKELIKGLAELSFQVQQQSNRLIFEMNGIPATTSGFYTFEFYEESNIKQEKLGEVEFEVEISVDENQ